MLNKVKDSMCIYKFSKNNAPVLTVPSGAVVVVDTMDCYSNQIQKPEDMLDSLDWDKINPASGPVYIEGALPGDVIKITIEDIVVKDQGVIESGENLGVLGDYIKGVSTKLVKIKNGYIEFDDKLSIPVKPMIGVIGVAPEGEDLNSGTPGHHGGNMDNTMIGKGAVLYLPVFAEGALLALGDLHAVMGDGEVGVSGVEAAGSVTLRLDVIKNLKLENPLLENDEYFSTIASAKLLDDAINTAALDMALLISKKLPLPMHEISMLMSIAGNTQICQIVDPLKTARFVMPKWVLEKYNFVL